MLFRETENGLVLFTQPAHAWLSAQLAMHWGNDTFARPEPWAEVMLAIAIHDQGWLEWETAPEVLPDTGRPRDFMHMELAEHLAIWRRSITWARAQSLYGALLISRHATSLTQSGLNLLDEAEEAKSLRRAFIAEQECLQAELRRTLASDPVRRPWVEPSREEMNLRLLQVCDLLSLAICGAWAFPREIARVPYQGPGSTITLKVCQTAPNRFALTPYPFDAPQFAVHAEARLLSASTFPDTDTFRGAIERAPVQLWEFSIEEG